MTQEQIVKLVQRKQDLIKLRMSTKDQRERAQLRKKINSIKVNNYEYK